jgi:transcription initiation factor TFIIB
MALNHEIDALFERLNDYSTSIYLNESIDTTDIVPLDEINKMDISMEEKRKLKKERRLQIKENKLSHQNNNEIPDYEQALICHCGGDLYFHDDFPICIKCGSMYEDNIDMSPEWRFYGADDNGGVDPARCGAPTNIHMDSSIIDCTIIYNGKASYKMRNIRRYTEWMSIPYKEKSQIEEFNRISQMASIAGIPKLIIDDAIRYHRKVSAEKTFRALNRDGIISASIYIACRLNNYPRTAREIAHMFELDATSAIKGCKNAMLIINKLEKTDTEKTELCSTKPSAFIERYCSKLDLTQELTKVCMFVAMKVDQLGYMKDKSPHSIAIGIVYMICKECHKDVDRKALKDISNISEVTINKCYKLLVQHKTELIPPMILKKYSA